MLLEGADLGLRWRLALANKHSWELEKQRHLNLLLCFRSWCLPVGWHGLRLLELCLGVFLGDRLELVADESAVLLAPCHLFPQLTLQ